MHKVIRMDKPYNFNIELEKLKYLYKNLVSAVLAALIISILTYLALSNKVDKTVLDLWIGLSISLSVARLLLFLKFKHTEITSKNILKYFFLFIVFLFLSSLLWAIVPFVLFPKEIEYQILLFFMIGGLCAGAMISLAVKHKYYLGYLFLSILPILFVMYLQNTKITMFVSIAGLIYMLFLLALSKQISSKVIENIKLVYDNEKLIIDLKQKVKEANSASVAKSNFLSVMSHEIRTPLNAIIGFVKILKDTETNMIKKKYLNTIDSSSFLLMNVINDVLDISKIESGNFNVEVIPYEPYTELYQLYDLYERSATQNGVNLKNSISMDMPLYLEGDILRLKQIVSNLLSNAIKFTESGKNIELIVKYEKESSMLYVEVKDEGIGIKQSDLDKITKEFTQADSSTARKYGGTGLGLSIVTKLLSLQNSKLEIDSVYGEGSRFYFRLPVAYSNKQKEVSNENIEFDFSNKHILVAEDNKTNQMLITIILEDMNIKVSLANNGIEAEDMFRENKYDLVLMDINMPNKNGSEAMKEVKKFNKDIPIVALTANAISGDREKYINEGFDEYLSKPINNNELKLVLKRFLG